MRLGVLILLLLCAPLTIVVFYQGVAVDVAVRRDILVWLDKAKAATTAEDMAYFIDKALDGLDKWGMYEGTWDWLYVNQDNYMEVSRKLLQSLRDRCLEIEKTQPRGSMGYAESLEEIKRTFESIAINPWAWYTLRHAPWIYYWWAWLPVVWLASIAVSVADETDFRCRFGLHDWKIIHPPPSRKRALVYQKCKRCRKKEVIKSKLFGC